MENKGHITHLITAGRALFTGRRSIIKSWLFTALPAIFFAFQARAQVLEQDSLALVALYDSTNGDSWDNKTNWKDTVVSAWHGITVTEGRVTVIDLSGNNLEGTIPAALGDPDSLEYLDLADNQLTGAIPAALGNLTNLTELWLSENQLEGGIPAALGDLDRLKDLSLYNNQLTGTIPAALGNLYNLDRLYLSNNQLSGTIPPELGGLGGRLLILSLSNNQLSGTIPPELGNLYGLEHLNLENNQLSGTIPSELGKVGDWLYTLSLSNNQLSGTIPPELGDLYSLGDLNLENNQLSGIIPPAISDSLSLGAFTIQGNQYTFGGVLSYTGAATYTYDRQDSVGTAYSLSLSPGDDFDIDLGIDSLIEDNVYEWYRDGHPVDTTSVSRFAISHVDYIHAGAYTCEVTNPARPDLTLYSRSVTLRVIPLTDRQSDSLALVALYDSTNGRGWANNANWLVSGLETWHGITVTEGRVTAIDLAGNNLEGTIPAALGDLNRLEYLDLARNQLTGTIPAALGNLTNLTGLWLSENQLEGNIPAALGDPDSLEYLDLADNQLTGTIPAALGNLTNLTRLWLPYNQLEGNIPAALGDLCDLKSLDLFNNQLSGNIPPELGRLEDLEALYLGGNQLSGLIPPAISDSLSLRIFNIQDNQYTFEGVLSYTKSVDSYIYTYHPQDRVGMTDTIYATEGSDAVIDPLSTDASLTDNIYRWYQGDTLRSERNEDELELENIALADAGNYTCHITNPGRPDLTLYSRSVTLRVIPLTDRELDSLALVALYESTNGDHWRNDTNWLVGDLETWYGITVRGDRVTSVNLSSNNLYGTLPSELGDLTSLRYLDLHNNELIGSVPPELSRLNNLVELYLFANALSGTIPAALGDLSNLSVLGLSYNLFSGSVPAALGNLNNLLIMDLSNNALSGTIPAALGGLEKIKALDLSNNQLSGLIPPEISDLNLLRFFVQGNQYTFEGVSSYLKPAGYTYAPQDSVGMTEIFSLFEGDSLLIDVLNIDTVLTLTDTIFYQWYQDGELRAESTQDELVLENISLDDAGNYTCHITHPDWPDLTLYSRPVTVQVRRPPVKRSDSLALVALYRSTNGEGWEDNEGWLSEPVYEWEGIETYANRVTAIDLPENNLNGTLPAALGDLTNLVKLELKENQLRGEIPAALGNLTHLTELDLEDNILSGNIPAALGSLTSLIALDLADNKLSGFIPDALSSLVNLEYFYLYDNQLTGEIPEALGNLTNLIELDLETNQLSGSVPDTLGSLVNLTTLWLSDNLLEGTIPPALGNLTHLERLYLHDNQLTGEIPAALGNLTGLTELNLADNELSGSVPDTLGSLVNLTNLSVANNLLEGAIPPALGNLTNLKYLYMYDNALSGEIPEALGNLTGLLELDLETNQLTGSIPDTLGHLVGLTELWLANNLLEGTIPPTLGNLTSLQQLHLQNNRLTGLIPAGISAINLNRFTIQDNQYTFEGVLSYTRRSGYTYSPQDSVDVTMDTVAVSEGDTLLIDPLDIDASLDGSSTYKWYRNNELRGTSTNGTLSMENITLADSGNYTCRITNPARRELTLYSRAVTIQVSRPPIREADSLALVALYDSTNGNSWTNSAGWLTGQVHTWEGIETYADRVTAIRLAENNLTGALPPELANLTELRVLRLGDNQLTGNILPELVSLNHLTNLSLYNNQLTGAIPPALGGLTNLLRLSLYGNALSDSIPPELGNLSNLRRLYLRDNQLTGIIPPALGNLGALIELDLGNNRLTGAIPPALGRLTNLSLLSLYGNALHDSIPSGLGDLSHLQSLHLHNNRLEGAIPARLGRLTNLTDLSMHNNELSDSIPSELGDLNGLQSLYLHNNRLEGAIPARLGRLTELVELTLNNNQLSGVIPRGLSRLTALIVLSLNNNRLNGSIPGELGNLNKLETLYLQSNRLEGELPEELASLESLKELNLSRNELEDTIPARLGSLSNLLRLYLNDNQLTGNIPPELGGINSLTELSLSNNLLSDSIPPQLGQLINLTRLDLQQNKLTGQVPDELDRLSSLTFLSLANNRLDGTIPAALADLRSLTTLLLNNNAFTGAPPADLADLELLTTLNLSSNRLEGVIPTAISEMVSLGDFQIQKNRYTFEGVLSYIDTTANYIYSPQSRVGGERTEKRTEGDSLVIELDIDAGITGNEYFWQKNDSTAVDVTDESRLVLKDLVLADSGAYTCTITNTDRPALVLYSNPVHLTVSPLPFSQADSLVLVDFYHRTGGSNWTDRTNWLSGSVNSWVGITVASGRVQSIDLPGNKLSGTLPPDLGNLGALRRLDLKFNDISGEIPPELGRLQNLEDLNLSNNDLSDSIPDALLEALNLTTLILSGNAFDTPPMPVVPHFNLSLLALDNNQLDTLPALGGAVATVLLPNIQFITASNNCLGFEDLEPNIDVRADFLYNPQLPKRDTMTIFQGDTITIGSLPGGTKNRYKWTKDDEPLGHEEGTYTLEAAQPIHAGTYRRRTTNDLVPDLTLEYSFVLRVEGSFAGSHQVQDPFPYCIGDTVVTLTATQLSEEADSVLWYRQWPPARAHLIAATPAIRPSIVHIIPATQDRDTLYVLTKAGPLMSERVDTVILTLRPTIMPRGDTLTVMEPKGVRYIWRRNGQVLEGVTGDRYTMPDEESFARYTVTVITDQRCSSTSRPWSRGELTTGLADEVYDITLYPNPAGNRVVLRYRDDYRGAVEVSVRDFTGRVALSTTLQKRTERMKQAVDISALPAGMYTIHIYVPGKPTAWVAKLFKQ